MTCAAKTRTTAARHLELGALALVLTTTAACQPACADKSKTAASPPAASADASYPGTLDNVLGKKQLRVLVPRVGGRALPRQGEPLSQERDLLQQFAAELDVELQLIHPSAFGKMLEMLQAGEADMAVASLVITPKRQQQADFTTPVGYVHQVLVGPKDAPVLQSPAELDGLQVVVRPGSVFYETLEKLRKEVPGLRIEPAEAGQSTQELLESVGAGRIPYTVSNSGLAAAVAGYQRNIQVVLALTEPKPLGWAVRKGSKRLLARLNAFLSRTAMTSHRQRRYVADLDGILERKVLRVLTRNNGITYWLHRGREVGFEYELVKGFAEQLGVRLEVIVPPARRDLIPWLTEGRGDLVAAMLTRTPEREEQVLFGAPYIDSTEVVVSRSGGPKVEKAEELAGKRVHVRGASRYHKTLSALSETLPTPIDIVPIDGWIETEEVIKRLADGRYDMTVAYSNVAQAEARYEPRLVVGPAIGEPRPVAWAVHPQSPKLKAAIDAFFTKGDYKPRGLMYNILRKRYLGQDQQQASALASRGADALSPFDPLIRRHSEPYQLDWRLIAAQMYQESRFDPTVVSPVGALGLMQVMPATARGLGVEDPRQPDQGIYAGVKYMHQLLGRFDTELPFQQRYHFALASYNAGKGHVDDARRLALELKLDPDVWLDNTAEAMLLLQKTKYARRARYGYCRGSEPVGYVTQIQSRFQAYSDFAKE